MTEMNRREFLARTMLGGMAATATLAAPSPAYASTPGAKGTLIDLSLIISAMLGRGEEPPSHKYLAEQRLAYAFIGGSTLAVIASGLVKVAKNIPGVFIDGSVVWFATLAHNVSAMLVIAGVLGHFAAFLIKANRALLPAMLHGHVDREYVAERHSLWYAELEDHDRAA